MNISLKQLRTLQAIVDCGSYAKAAQDLHISQSALSYAITKMQEDLGVKIFKLDGRKAILTPIGKSLIEHSKQVLKLASELENFARTLAHDEVRLKKGVQLVFDYNFPAHLIWQALKNFMSQNLNAPHIGIHELSVLHLEEYMEHNSFDLAISNVVPVGCLAEPLVYLEYIPVAHPSHELIKVNREVTESEMLEYFQIMVGQTNNPFEWAEQSVSSCWRMNSFETALAAVMEGHGYAWLPKHKIMAKLESGEVKLVRIKRFFSRKVILYLVHNRLSPFYHASHSFIEAMREISKQNVFVH